MTEVHLFQLPDAAILLLAAGQLEAASAAAGIALPRSFVTPEDRHTWSMRGRQITEDAACASWITRAVVDAATGTVVGRAGFHGPPDDSGMVEVGYAIDQAHRRRGFARAAFEILYARARAEPTVRTLRASIRPDNTASSNLIDGYGFVKVGEQWDEVDGLEIVYEVNVA